jgi:hypothetical protein
MSSSVMSATGCLVRDAGHVGHHVQAAELVHGPVHQRIHGLLGGDVHLVGDRRAPSLGDAGRDVPGTVEVQVGHDHVGADGGQDLAGCLADAAGPTGDHRGPAGHVEDLQHVAGHGGPSRQGGSGRIADAGRGARLAA